MGALDIYMWKNKIRPPTFILNKNYFTYKIRDLHVKTETLTLLEEEQKGEGRYLIGCRCMKGVSEQDPIFSGTEAKN